MKIAIVTTCMGRAHHLRSTLPRFVNQTFDDFQVYVVDWSSPDDLAAWLAHERPAGTRRVHMPGRRFFHLAAARNAGGDRACRDGAGLLAFLDADILIPERFLERNWIVAEAARERYGDKFFLQTKKLLTDTGEDFCIWGSCIVPSALWQATRYNERITTYGHEDNELYSLWVESGVKHLPMRVEGVEGLVHSDEDRMRYYPEALTEIRAVRQANKRLYRGTRTDLF